MKSLISFLMLWAWILGIGIAKGFWVVTACIIFPPFSWLVFAEWFIARISC